MRGSAPTSDSIGSKIAHVGITCASNNPDHWDPWLGTRVNHPITPGPPIPSGSKLRNRFCLNPAERERRHLDNSRAKETIIHDTRSGDHLDDPLPSVCVFSRSQTSADDIEYESESDPGVVELDEESFWNSLEDTPIDLRGDRLRTRDLGGALREFTLFERNPDGEGLADAILDAIKLIEDGQVENLQECVEAVARVADTLHLSDDNAPPDAKGPDEEVVEIKADGLPDEHMISFLFDDVSHSRIDQRAQEEPAFKRLAALRDRVLARINQV